MRALILTLLIFNVFAFSFQSYKIWYGHIYDNNNERKEISGTIIIEKDRKSIVIDGNCNSNYTNNSRNFTFFVESRITNITNSSRNYTVIYAKCVSGSLLNNRFRMQGTITAEIWNNTITYYGNCSSLDDSTQWRLTANGTYKWWPFNDHYNGAKRAKSIVGQPTSTYKVVNVLNYAIIGHPYMKSINNCTWYLYNLRNSNITTKNKY